MSNNGSLWDVTSTDLDQWAQRLEARSVLPRLVRRLIHATAREVHRIGFPADESTQLGGYDGVVQVLGGPPHAPDGQSVWELGVNKDVKGKADDDYDTRKKNPGGVSPKDTTFVFVTPRRWGGKKKWVTERQKEGFWKDVWALDSDDLEEWLERAPAVAAWLGRLIGKRFDGVTDLQETWDAWAHRTEPAISTGLVLAGRADAVTALGQWIERPATAVRVRAATAAESLAFFCAFVRSLPADRQVVLLSRSVVVTSATALARLRSGRLPLVIIPQGEWDPQPHLAVRNSHHVLLPAGPETPEDGQDIVLPAIPRRAFEEALCGMGLAEERAREVARECRGQLAVLNRLLVHGPAAQPPVWASPAEGVHVVPLLLAGGWDRGRAADQQALHLLAGRPYAEVEAVAVRWHSTSDSPVRLTGAVWEWVSRDDGWHHLASRISPCVVDAFERVVLDVLGTPDPRYSLPADQRWAAALHGQVLPHSEKLRESLAHSLALLAIRPTAGVRAGGHQPRVDAVVWRLLGRRDGPALWPSLSPLLPLLAEAAPDAFLACLNEAVLGDDAVRQAMFEQEGPWGGSPHTGLLWALENLAWSPLYLAQAAVALARLAARDPGGNLGNRPIVSLRELFLPWLPHTRADLSQRLQAIDALAAREPAVAWDLCLRLLPHGPDHSMTTHKPRWRAWHESGARRVTNGEYWDAVSAAAERLLGWAGNDGARWAQLLGTLQQFPRPLVQRLVDRLRQFVESAATPGQRTLAWSALREALRRQRQYLESRRGRLPARLLRTLDRLYCRLAPADVRSRVVWLFTARPELPDLETDDWRAEQEAIAQARRQAIDAVAAAEGVGGLLRLADAADQPSTVGWAVGASAMTEEQVLPLLDQCLGGTDGARAECGRALVMARFCQAGAAWPQRFFSAGPGQGWPVERRVAFARGLPFAAETWDLVGSWGEEAHRGYWRSAPARWLDQRERDAERCVRHLLDAGRPWAALDHVTGCYCGPEPRADLPTELVMEVMRSVSRSDPAAEPVPVGRNSIDLIDRVFDHLEGTGEVEEAELARMEWLYLPALRHLRRGTPILQRMLAREPGMFVEVLAAGFRSEDEDRSTEQVPDAQAVARATHAHHLLEEWRLVPGTRDDGGLDPAALDRWVGESRRLCQERGYRAIGDQQIGQILARAPAGADGMWPHEAVRALIERLECDDLELGLLVGVRRARGGTWRALDEGGRQEWRLAERYNQTARSVAASSPRTAQLLRSIAGAYEADARREDHESALMEYT